MNSEHDSSDSKEFIADSHVAVKCAEKEMKDDAELKVVKVEKVNY